MPMRFALILAALVALPGCDALSNDTSRLELVVNRTQFVAGEEALLVIDNDTGEDQGYSHGPVLQRRVDERGYVAVDPNAFYPDALSIIGAGKSIAFRAPLPDTLGEGTYRFVVSAGALTGGPNGVVASGAFRVARPE